MEGVNENPGPGMYNFKGFADEVIEKAKKFKRPQYMKPIIEESNKNEQHITNANANANDNNVLNTNESNKEQNEDQETIVLQTDE